ncbi:NAD-dependent epimerase/dehydratase family protein [Patescibacteria group bacterium]|nr:NAD-dependent epimerase/dehydratase family protein [Patescibacteria group bacterium]
MVQKLILVTGGAGFIGSHLCARLAAEGHQVISLDNYFTGSRENHVPGVEYREGHTKDIERHIPETPDLIYHLGEYSRVEQSILEPDRVRDLNTLGTLGVIDFWRKRQCKLVYAGSSTKFGDEGAARYATPYAKTKADNSETIVRIGNEEHLSYAITYFYNVYGPRERSGVYGTVIEHFKRMYVSGTPCAVVSPGTQERNFTHVFDVVDGLIKVGEEGQGDEYGLGNKEAYSILEIAHLFGFDDDDIVMFPPRQGNRLKSRIDTSKTERLGWEATRSIAKYIREYTSLNARGARRDKRIVVFSVTLHPIAGPAEEAMVEVARMIPDVAFDVITARFARNTAPAALPSNITLYRVGIGYSIDKFLLIFLGPLVGLSLLVKRRYLFVWSLMAGYAALAALLFKLFSRMPVLITLADQNLEDLSFFRRALLSLFLARADQVYGTHHEQEKQVKNLSEGALSRNSLGEGDAFANALRYAYADVVRGQKAV